ncbi:MAG TPA: helix-turn-helix domain-containing protein [Aliidongia sp.]|nr:helix-turn-helix domain-containing protein [Aliidongia sp.]
MKRTSLEDAHCPVARSLDVVGDWWTLLIVRDALNGARRFSEFQKGLGLAKNILSGRLRKMVADGILELRPAADGGAHHEYHLTEKGTRLRMVLTALRQWGEQNLFAEGEPMMVAMDKETGQPIARLVLAREDGTRLGPTDVMVKMGRAGEPFDS